MLGKGIATCAVWGSVAVSAIYAGPACMVVALIALVVTVVIWD